MHRLFAALRPPPPVRAALLDLMGGIPGARWQVDEQLHLTIRFIGEVERAQAEDVALAITGVRHPALTLRLAGVGTFATRGRPHTLWAGVTPHDALASLYRKVNAALARAGVPPEPRAFHPHITLARLNAGTAPVEPFLATHAGLASDPFAMEHLTLFESVLARDGAEYEAIARVALD